MKILYFITGCLLFLLPESIEAQITNIPPQSFTSQLKSNVSIPIIEMPSFDLEKLKAEDQVNDQKANKVFRFGYEHKVAIDLKSKGNLTKLANGDKIWRLRIFSKGAKTLNFVFDQYRLPEGATLHLYNLDKSFVLGAYTNKMNNKNNSLGTWLAEGDMITLEYFVPATAKSEGLLHLGSVVHGYRSVTDTNLQQKNLNASGNCNQDVNCEIGNDFEARRDVLKQSVALIISPIGSFCTGTLINNTENDKAPYLLTAFHCGGGEANWSFRFNWISENTVCATDQENIDNGPDNFYQTTSGSERLALSEESDMRLIRITGGLDDRWNLTWAGWDRSGDVPDYTVSIHHPRGDIMKISRDNESPVKSRASIDRQSSEVWRTDDWDIGVTEKGSSGSALFDQNGRIIGQLFGGGAFCDGLSDNNEPDVFGRFDVSWDFGTTEASRLSDWLDPINTGVEVLDELIQISSLTVDDLEPTDQKIVIYPNPVKEVLFIENNTIKNLTYQLYNVTGQLVASKRLIGITSGIPTAGFTPGMYFLKLIDSSNQLVLHKKIVVK
ncbi:T9SS type A sorting domain-containing protein [Aquimarina sp. ERC-38]|uniref:T9SS type A sorting domain-containing protein n=1 Tax=Aquimarina sp. ERC-38 TaxID=2949996 RepID=UPI002247316B|nr:T9SS type A sorting domain-containing protein [Aquimarina sp. ERC-38]UZO81152.1 T9SS type A sorting domain-containing protein [Aquimarina sp. ERC-38]